MASEAKHMFSGHSTLFIADKPRKTAAPWSKSRAAVREHGSRGVGLAELTNAAGLTCGGFYKQFK
jgi:hypothetical protein